MNRLKTQKTKVQILKHKKVPHDRPFEVVGFHSCDRKTGASVLNGKMELKHSTNPWDWLGNGVYFWEQNPLRALEYAIESAAGEQFNRIRIEEPFVLGAIIELGNCLNLLEPESLALTAQAFDSLKRFHENLGKKMPENDRANRNNRKLDCAVIKHLHKSGENNPALKYDSIRCAFVEGKEI
jgi:hypothetical protein